MSMVMGFPNGARSDKVDCGNGASLNLLTAISVDVLVKFPMPSGNQIVFMCKWNTNVGWLLQWDGTNDYFFLYVADGIVCRTTYPLNGLNKWTHVCFTFTSGAATGKGYINGVDRTDFQAAKALGNPAVNLIVGNYVVANLAPNNGFMAAVNIYDRVLSPSEVAYNYAHPNNPIKKGLIVGLTQESLFAGTWRDISGNANHGTLSATGVGPIPSNNLAGRQVSL